MLVVSLSEACSLIEKERVKSALSSFTCFDKVIRALKKYKILLESMHLKRIPRVSQEPICLPLIQIRKGHRLIVQLHWIVRSKEKQDWIGTPLVDMPVRMQSRR